MKDGFARPIIALTVVTGIPNSVSQIEPARGAARGKSATVRSPASVFVAFAAPSGSSERRTLILSRRGRCLPAEPANLPAEALRGQRGESRPPALGARGGDERTHGRAVEAFDRLLDGVLGRSALVSPSQGLLVTIPRRCASPKTPFTMRKTALPVQPESPSSRIRRSRRAIRSR